MTLAEPPTQWIAGSIFHQEHGGGRVEMITRLYFILWSRLQGVLHLCLIKTLTCRDYAKMVILILLYFYKV